MNDSSIVTKFESGRNLKGPINDLFDIELLLIIVFLVKLAPQVAFLTMLHDEVVIVIVLLVVYVPEINSRSNPFSSSTIRILRVYSFQLGSRSILRLYSDSGHLITSKKVFWKVFYKIGQNLENTTFAW